MSGSLEAELHKLFAGRGVGGCVMVRRGRSQGECTAERSVVCEGVVGVSWVRVEGAAAKRREIEDSWLHGWDGRLRDTIAPKRPDGATI